ncbi:hypothetical protein PHLGIDRAFT_154382 [Phlebiopsis gigantea 11061_1 CR5-6]|uniref:Uncharacterized protein n=1 Tax=Phlebiopsis gigantea (strain 11061_1 CR5-6) TaxID=745531 RepID=A0A0C3NK55_PHLG1|nr:hypothetical protein PHLGIDRAFT_154382 [Phlebiopsis gigantea 11061_1 CR5-6]
MASIFNKQKRSSILDLKTLRPAAIIDEISREFAFGMLELNLVDPAVDKLSLVEELYSTPHLLEFVVSAIPQMGFQSLIDWISHCVPDDPRKYEDSILFRMLSRFALCCGALPFQSPELDECQRAVELAPRVLKELAILWRVGEAVEVTAEEAVAKGKAKRVPQRVAKKAKRAGHVPQVDVSVFTMIEVAVPSSQEEAVALAQQILIDQSNVLKHYFNVLRKPEASAIMQKNYLDITTQTDTATTTGLPHTDEDVTGFPDIIPETEPQTTFEEYSSQPVQNALFFASAEGFGDWRLMMAQRVIKYLEDTRKRNPKAFKIAVKKMRELSHGHFSADNQKRLEGSDNGLPIFEAKMSRDTRLIVS